MESTALFSLVEFKGSQNPKRRDIGSILDFNHVGSRQVTSPLKMGESKVSIETSR